MATQNEAPKTKVITGLVRFSYVHVWEPEAIGEGSDKKYSVSLIIPKSDKETLKEIEAAIDAAKKAGKDSKFAGKIPANLKTPLRDGDEDRPDDEAYANCYFVNATSRTKPGVVDKNVKPILDQDEFYSGCYGRASITFFAFNTNGNKGIACGLNHVQKLKDGEAMGGRSSAESDFEGFKPLAEDPDDLF
jgi:hypothetical protein